MKKLLLTLVVGLMAWTASAQNWGIGGRIGSGLDVVGQKYFNNDNYIELRVGAYFLDGIGVDISGLYTWNIANMNWTPKAGTWFFDAGVGANVGFNNKHFHIGPQGMAKLGIAFKAPVRLSLDWSPTFGVSAGKGESGFYGMGLGNFGITCVYAF